MGETVKVLDRNGVLQLCSALKTKNDSLYVSKSGGSISVDWSSVQNKPSFANVATSGSYNDLSNKPTIPAATNASSQITAMTGYSKPSSASAIAATDTLNQAIGKLEYKVDSLQVGVGSTAIQNMVTQVFGQ